MTVVAPLYTTCWGMLKQPDNQKPSNVNEMYLKVSSFQPVFGSGKAS
jgi:hypothetical protein